MALWRNHHQLLANRCHTKVLQAVAVALAMAKNAGVATSRMPVAQELSQMAGLGRVLGQVTGAVAIWSLLAAKPHSKAAQHMVCSHGRAYAMAVGAASVETTLLRLAWAKTAVCQLQVDQILAAGREMPAAAMVILDAAGVGPHVAMSAVAAVMIRLACGPKRAPGAQEGVME